MSTNLERIEALLREDISRDEMDFPSIGLLYTLTRHCTTASAASLRNERLLAGKLFDTLLLCRGDGEGPRGMALRLAYEFGVVIPVVETTRPPVGLAWRVGATLRKLFNALTGAR